MEQAVFDTWEQTEIDLKRKTSGQLKTQCPVCSHTRRNKKDTCLSVNITDKVFNCAHCSWNGYVRKYEKGSTSVKKEYAKPDYNYVAPSEKMIAWFKEKRGITEETLTKFLVYPKETYFHVAGKVVPCIGFPYIKKGAIVNIKSRYDYVKTLEDGSKKKTKTFMMEKDAELTLYNIDAVVGQKVAIITEGEIDAMTVHQSGWAAVCSVPNGAPPIKIGEDGKPNPIKMEYLNDATYAFKDAERIIIATDGDEVGMHLRDELARRLGRWRCEYIEWPEGYKDFNEVMHGSEEKNLPGAGEEGVMQVIDTYTSRFPVEGVITVEDVQDTIDQYYYHGFPVGKKIGFEQYDKQMSYREGEVTTITGIPSHGKSEWHDEVLTRLSQQHQWPHALFAAENGGSALHSTRLIHRYIEKPFQHRYNDERMTPEELYRGKCFVNDYFYWIDQRKAGLKLDTILELGRELVLDRGVKTLTIDPFNCVDNERPAHVSETEWVSRIYAKLVGFAEDNQAHVFVIAHPTKMSQNLDTGNYLMPNLYSISGSANFYNKTFNGQVVYRDFVLDQTRIATQKVKFDFVGSTGTSDFTFNKHRRRYEEI